jgi:integrase
MASINKAPQGWRARWRTPDGLSRSKTFERKADAQRHLASVEHSKLAGSYVDPAAGKVTFHDYAEAWRQVQIHRPATTVSVEHQLRLHVYPVLGHRPLSGIRTTEIQALVRQLSASLAPATVAVVYGRVVAVFRAAVRDRIIAITPCVQVRLPSRRSDSVDEVLSPEDVLRLADAVPDRYRAVILTGAGLGLRPGELFGLTIDWVEFLRRVVRVDRQLVRVAGGVEVGPLKTQSSYRSVPLPDLVSEAIATHLRSWPAHAELGLVFTNERGGPIQQHPLAMVFEHARARVGLPEWATPHDLRHFYASTLIRSGASVKVIQSRLGHSSAKTTLDVYGHLFPDEQDRTRAAMDDALRLQPAETDDPSGGRPHAKNEGPAAMSRPALGG